MYVFKPLKRKTPLRFQKARFLFRRTKRLSMYRTQTDKKNNAKWKLVSNNQAWLKSFQDSVKANPLSHLVPSDNFFYGNNSNRTLKTSARQKTTSHPSCCCCCATSSDNWWRLVVEWSHASCY